MKDLIDISLTDLVDLNNIGINESIAHKLISNKEQVLMIFERPSGSYYGYKATQFTDLWHGKKQTINELVWFFRDIELN